MGRLVRSARPRQAEKPTPGVVNPQAGLGEEEAGDEDSEGDGYLQRVAKYVPAEVIGFYIFVNGLLSDAVNKAVAAAAPAGHAAQLADALEKTQLVGINVWCLSLVLFGFALLMIPLYFFNMQDEEVEGEHLWLTIVMGLLAFPVWAYAIGALVFREFYDGTLASIGLAIFTVLSGAVKPGLWGRIRKAVFGK